METVEYRFVEKAGWGPGPWQEEPDKVQWADGGTGLACLARRNARNGSWCGYVGVGNAHPAYGKDHTAVDVSVHGGLTYSEACEEDDKEYGICHIAGPGEEEPLWWFGFDCAHAWDLLPGLRAQLPEALSWPGDIYRTLAYVKSECADLAKQLETLGGDSEGV
jgi:hypothetical protein